MRGSEGRLFTLGLAAALLIYAAVFVAIVSVKSEQAKPAPHKVVTTSSGEVVQFGSALRTNEATSTIPNGNAITCFDSNRNGRVAVCRMKDRQSGDIVSVRDGNENDLYFAIRQGVSGRRYDWHQNGYRNCWTCADHWGDRKSVHDGIAGTGRSQEVTTEGIRGW